MKEKFIIICGKKKNLCDNKENAVQMGDLFHS